MTVMVGGSCGNAVKRLSCNELHAALGEKKGNAAGTHMLLKDGRLLSADPMDTNRLLVKILSPQARECGWRRDVWLLTFD